MRWKVMILEIATRPFEVEGNNPQEAIENVQKLLETPEGDLPESTPLQLLSPFLWPVVKISSLIVPETGVKTEITKIN